ncbi:MAG: nitroreductase family protein [Armatimonadota bacterium]
MMDPVRKPAPADHSVLETIRERWSPWAFAPTPVPAETLASLLEAARWAPSSMNEQPWRFVVGDQVRSPEVHAALASALLPGNALWAASVPLLILVCADTLFRARGTVNRFALHDAGQATAFLQLQATAIGLRCHPMGGYDAAKARVSLGIPDDHETGALLAIGYPESPTVLEDETVRAKETNPVRVRRPLSELVHELWGVPFPIER